MALCDTEPHWTGGSWFQDLIVFSAGNKIYSIPASGGKPESLAAPDKDGGERAYSGPKLLPGGKSVLFDAINYPSKEPLFQIRLLSIESGKQKVVINEGINAYCAPTGHLVYQNSNMSTLMAAPFDLNSLDVKGDPVPMVEGIHDVNVTFASDGTLAYVPQIPGPKEDALIWVDRDGRQLDVMDIKEGWEPRQISPDGNRIALIYVEDNKRDIWIYDLQVDLSRRLTFEGKTNEMPIWTPDGKWITFVSDHDGPPNLYRKLADGSRAPERLTESEFLQAPGSWSPDGNILSFEQMTDNNMDIWVVPMTGDRMARPFVTSADSVGRPRFSPDGRWLAYASWKRDEDGRTTKIETYVRPYPSPDVKWLVSGEEGGGVPVWSPNGTELYYLSRDSDKMMVTPIQTQPTFRAGKPKVLFEGKYAPTFHISSDGERFLVTKQVHRPPNRINIVLNWFEELKHRVPKG